MSPDRKATRAPLQVAVSYRTSGAFLVAYSINLSKGGIFLEAEPLPVGSEIHLELEVPDAGKLDVDGVVAWVRTDQSAGLPVGMGIQFTAGLDERHGEQIDRLVSTFDGLEILIMAAAERRVQLARYVTSILTCETVEVNARATAEVVLADRVDLALVDLDTAGPDGMEVVKMARRSSPPTPLIVLSNDGESTGWARAQGADGVVRSPPTFGELQQAVIAALSRGVPRAT